MKELDNILKKALERKPSRLSFETRYDHKNLFDWLQSFLPDWTIVTPEKSCALSDWPTSETTRNEVKIWLEEKNYPDPDDLIDGACEPLAYYLSSSISKIDFDSFLSLETLSKQKEFVYSVYTQVKNGLDELDARVACEEIFGAYIQQNIPSPKFWPEITEGTFNHFLFGHQLAKDRIQEVVTCGDGTTIIPLYVLCYIFDNDELTTSKLKSTKVETAQYSLHAIGLVINRSTKTIIVADPNGALIKGFNIEFLSMPLTKLKRKATTSVSRSDREKEGFIVAPKDGSKKRTCLDEKI